MADGSLNHLPAISQRLPTGMYYSVGFDVF